MGGLAALSLAATSIAAPPPPGEAPGSKALAPWVRAVRATERSGKPTLLVITSPTAPEGDRLLQGLLTAPQAEWVRQGHFVVELPAGEAAGGLPGLRLERVPAVAVYGRAADGRGRIGSEARSVDLGFVLGWLSALDPALAVAGKHKDVARVRPATDAAVTRTQYAPPGPSPSGQAPTPPAPPSGPPALPPNPVYPALVPALATPAGLRRAAAARACGASASGGDRDRGPHAGAEYRDHLGPGRRADGHLCDRGPAAGLDAEPVPRPIADRSAPVGRGAGAGAAADVVPGGPGGRCPRPRPRPCPGGDFCHTRPDGPRTCSTGPSGHSASTSPDAIPPATGSRPRQPRPSP